MANTKVSLQNTISRDIFDMIFGNASSLTDVLDYTLEIWKLDIS